MVLDRYRKEFEAFTSPVAEGFRRFGVTPNVITVVSFFFAIAAGVLFAVSAPGASPWLLVGGAACVAINAILDGVDGRLARITGSASRKGDYLDHVIDRYSDLAILLGISLSAWVDIRWGLAAIVGTFLTSYMGTQAQALGLGRNYRGLLGRADRLVLLIGTPVVQALFVFVGFRLPWGGSLLNLLLAYFAIMGNLTALQRFWFGWKELSETET